MPFCSFRICIASCERVPNEEQCLFGTESSRLSPIFSGRVIELELGS